MTPPDSDGDGIIAPFYDPAQSITAYTDVVTPFGTVRLCWRDNYLAKVQMGTFDPVDRHATVRRYMPPHQEGQRLIVQFLAYFKGEKAEFNPALPPKFGSDFQRRVWEGLTQIPYGQCQSYGELAENLGLAPNMARAVGNACGQNPFPVIIPCHRVVGATGALTGYTAGLAWKKALLQLEGVPIQHERVLVFK